MSMFPRFLTGLFELVNPWLIHPFISGDLIPIKSASIGSLASPFESIIGRRVFDENGRFTVNEIVPTSPMLCETDSGVAHISLNIDSDDFSIDDDSQKLTTRDLVLKGKGALRVQSTTDSDWLDSIFDELEIDPFPKTKVLQLKSSNDFSQSNGTLSIANKGTACIPFYQPTGFDYNSNFKFDGAETLSVGYIKLTPSLQLQDEFAVSRKYVSQFIGSEAGSALDVLAEVSGSNRRNLKLRIHPAFFKVNTQNNLELKQTYRKPLFHEFDANSSEIHLKYDDKSIKINAQDQLEFGLNGKGIKIDLNTSNISVDIDETLKFVSNQLSLNIETTAPLKITNGKSLFLDIDDSLEVVNGKLSAKTVLVDNVSIGWSGNKLTGLYVGQQGIQVIGDKIRGYTGGTRITISGSTISCNVDDITDDITQQAEDIAQNASQLASTMATAASGLAAATASWVAAATGIGLAQSAIAGNAVNSGLIAGLTTGLAATDAALSIAGLQTAANSAASGVLQAEIAALGVSTAASIGTLTAASLTNTAAISTLVGTTGGLVTGLASVTSGLLVTDGIVSSLGVAQGATAASLATNIGITSGLLTNMGIVDGILGTHTANLVAVDASLVALTSSLSATAGVATSALGLASTANGLAISAEGLAISAGGTAGSAMALSTANSASIAFLSLMLLGSSGDNATSGLRKDVDEIFDYIADIKDRHNISKGTIATLQEVSAGYLPKLNPIVTGNMDVSGVLTVGSAGTKNMIRFFGTQGDYNDGLTANNSCIVNRLVSGSETSELLLFSGNDILGSPGADAIRLMAAEVYVDLYAAAGSYNWDTNTPPVANRKLTITQTQATFANSVFVGANRLATETFVTSGYQTIAGMSVYQTKAQSDALYPTLTNFNTLNTLATSLYSNAYLDTQFNLRLTTSQLDSKLVDWSTKTWLTTYHYTKSESESRYMPATPGQIELGYWNSDTPAYIDFHAKVGSGDNESRIIRAGGTNGTFSIINNAAVAISGSSITLNNIPITDYQTIAAYNSGLSTLNASIATKEVPLSFNVPLSRANNVVSIDLSSYVLQSSLTTQLGNYLTTANAALTYMLKTNTSFSTLSVSGIVSMQTNLWHQSSEAYHRFYFVNGAHTIYKSGGAANLASHQFQNGAGSLILDLIADGRLYLKGMLYMSNGLDIDNYIRSVQTSYSVYSKVESDSRFLPITPGGFEMGEGLNGVNGNCIIDMHSSPGTDFDFRLYRQPGVNGIMQFQQVGSGSLQMNATNIELNGNSTCNGLLSVKADINCYRAIDYGQYYIHRNLSAGTNAFSILSIRNDLDNGIQLFINSSNRSTDGGVNVATLRNDLNTLRLAGFNNYLTLNKDGWADFNSSVYAPSMKVGEVFIQRPADTQGLHLSWNQRVVGRGGSEYVSHGGVGIGNHFFYNTWGAGTSLTEIGSIRSDGFYAGTGSKLATESWVLGNTFASQSWVTSQGFVTNNINTQFSAPSTYIGNNSAKPDSAILNPQIQLIGREVNANTQFGVVLEANWDNVGGDFAGPAFSLNAFARSNVFLGFNCNYSKTLSGFISSTSTPALIYQIGESLDFKYRSTNFWVEGSGNMQKFDYKDAMKINLTNGQVNINDNLVIPGCIQLGKNLTGDRWSVYEFFSVNSTDRSGYIGHAPGASGHMEYNNTWTGFTLPTDLTQWGSMAGSHRFIQSVSMHGALFVPGSINFNVPVTYGYRYPNEGDRTAIPPGYLTISIFSNASIACKGSFLAISDERTKKDIVHLDTKWCSDTVEKITPIHYRRKGDDVSCYGFSAQDVQKAATEAVQDVGNLCVDHNQLLGILWGAVRDLKKNSCQCNKHDHKGTHKRLSRFNRQNLRKGGKTYNRRQEDALET